MKKIILTLLLIYSNFSISQSFTGFKIGEKILNENIYIINDTIETKISVLEDGYCYRIESKFTDTDDSLENINYVENLVKTKNEWVSFNNTNSNDFYDELFNRDVPCFSCKFISCVIDNDVKYLIYYAKKSDEYDETKPGLILVEKKIKLSELQGIEKKIKNSPNTSITFTSYNECVNSPVYKDKKTTRVNLNDIKIETIELPYKLNFGMSNTQINNHFKSILDKNSTFTVKPFNGNEIDVKLGITYFIYNIKTNGANSFSVEVTFLNGKAVDYNYHHDYELNKKLKEKISILTKKYSILGTTFGNNIYDIKSKDRIAELKDNYRNRGNIGDKM
ncbi:hypothetical protein [Flavobacterium psychrophilum]|uniref:hypothetical protein n=1 Tax=Flavobacterium psychrophilum TaxID=96345 RepID=UPI00106D4088|nr:hypothetical protein [Flavobacterium psychrophilum]